MTIIISFAYGFIAGLVLIGANLEGTFYFIAGVLFWSVTYFALGKIFSPRVKENKIPV